ncbi:NADH oxidase [Streptomyces sp. NPDC050400]|uniref:NADH oxidase n=1 Tax=Streptomyces sp. NPDC050400 TaxID=3365610 RepID=UPI0037BAD93E
MSRVVEGRALHLWSLHEDVTVEQGDTDDELVLRSRFGTERISAPTPVVREALRRMQLGPVLLANISTRQLPADGTGGGRGAYLVLWPMLRRLSHLIVRTLSLEDLKGPLLSVITTRQGAGFTPVGVSAQRLIRLMSDVSMTLESAGLALRSAGSAHWVHLHRPEAVWVVGLLAWPVTPSRAAAILPLPPEVTEAVLSYLIAAGMTEDC